MNFCLKSEATSLPVSSLLSASEIESRSAMKVAGTPKRNQRKRVEGTLVGKHSLESVPSDGVA